MAYNRRDLIGHWVPKDQHTQKMCQHACCRGYRVHPANMPVVLPDPLLHRASEKDLEAHYERLYAQPETAQNERGRMQVLHELQRREDRAAAAEAVQERRRQRYAARRIQRQEIIEAEWLQAEAATRGHMLNRLGQQMHVNERTLFTGPESRARKYASPELIEYWEHHPRPTEAMMAGHDTRLGVISGQARSSYGRGARSEREYYQEQRDRAAAGAA